ncbi:MAG: hypothetical protein ACRC8S_17115 [Fimbriiglobus sp.]
MSERKQPDQGRLSKARRPYRIDPPPPGKRRKCKACHTPTVIRTPFNGGWVMWCPTCSQLVE